MNISALEALHNSLYKFKTYFTYLKGYKNVNIQQLMSYDTDWIFFDVQPSQYCFANKKIHQFSRETQRCTE